MSAARRLGALLVALGLCLVAWAATQIVRGQRAQQQALARLETLEESASGIPAEPAPPAPGDPVARIEAPHARIDAAAFEGIDAPTLRRGIGHFPGTALPGDDGNAAFAGHRDSFFRGLGRLRLGDEIRVTAPDGAWLYRATELRVVEPRQVEVVRSRGRPELTLVTCYPFDHLGPAPRRYVVHAELVGPVSDGT